MNIRDLQYLIALANQGSFSKAAAKCFISQPTLSMQIKKLETELGVTLLERNKKSVLFTAVGEQILMHTKEILFQIDQIKEAARQAQNPYAGEIKIAMIPSLAPYFLPHVLPSISNTYPDLQLFLSEAKTVSILQQLKEGVLDAGIIALPISEEFTVTHLFDEPFMLAVAKKHPLAQRKKVNFSELQDKRFMLLEEGHCLRDQALAVCNQANIPVDKSFQATSLETLYHMVSAGLGITLMPKLACKANDLVNYISLPKQPGFVRSIAMIWRNSSIKAQLLHELVELIKPRIMKVV